MLGNFFIITVALCIATMAYGQILEDNLVDLSNDTKIETVPEQDLSNSTKVESVPEQVSAYYDPLSRFVKVYNKYYYFGQTKESWYQSNLICRSLGGFLAAFDSFPEIQAISTYLIYNYPTNLYWWLSASDLATEGDFFWYKTGERVYVADWSVGEPNNLGGNENCVHLWYQGNKYQMNDWICELKANYICESFTP